MLKVIIADDEDKVCKLIYKLVDWEALDMQVVDIAHNGYEAMEYIGKHNPDIVITDIRMPGYDGLELIRKAKKVNKDIEFIIISGYRHFEYAQSAIKYGVSDYLLKPIKKDELVHTLEKIQISYRQKKELLSQEEELKLSLQSGIDKIRAGIFFDYLFQRNDKMRKFEIDVINREYHFSFQEGEFQIAAIKVDSNGAFQSGNVKFLEEKIVHIVSEELKNHCYEFETYLQKDMAYCILNYNPDSKKAIRKQMKAILDKLTLQENIFEQMKITMGMGKAVKHGEDLTVSLKLAKLAVEQRLIVGTGKVIDGESYVSSNFADSELFYKFNKDIILSFEHLNTYEIRNTLHCLQEEMVKRKETTGHEVVQMTKEVCNLYLMTMRNNQLPIEGEDSFMEEFNRNAGSYSTIEQLFHYLTTTIVKSTEKIVENKKQEVIKPIRLAKRYIQDNYMKGISLEEVSNNVGFSAAYFSTVFKKETGNTFLEYLSEVRINEAKEILKKSNMSIAAVCEQVGYSDVKHFTKYFIKYTGLKPNEYRKLYS